MEYRSKRGIDIIRALWHDPEREDWAVEELEFLYDPLRFWGKAKTLWENSPSEKKEALIQSPYNDG